MKLALLGGSFNPIHIGHLALAEAALSEIDCNRVMLIPTYQSPFKPNVEDGSPKDRLDMLTAVAAGDPRLGIDDSEIKRKGISYTIDTIKDIISRYRPEGKPALILGDDVARDFQKWRNAEEIAALTDIVIAHRISAGPLEDFPYRYIQLNNRIIEISSAQIRERIHKGEIWRYLLPDAARYIIEERGLYGYTSGHMRSSISHSLIFLIEHHVRYTLISPRFIHSRNTALLSWDLCLRFGLDPLKGYLAGIAHDICKPLAEDDIIALAKKDGREISKQERKKPSLLHGRAGAMILKDRFGIADTSILEAVRLHTVGDMNMGALAKIIYIADKIEVSRPNVDPALRAFSLTATLDELFAAVLDETVAHLRAEEMDVSEETLRLIDAIHKRDKL